MGRPLRPIGAGLTYHVTARGNSKRPIFIDDRDRKRFLDGLERAYRRYELRFLAYCLMGNHVHLAVTTTAANLPDAMRDILGSYAWWFNRRHGLEDHLFGKRHHTTLIETDSQMTAVLRYIARNPVRGGLVSDAADWPWSSYPAVLALAPAPRFLATREVLEWLDPDPVRAVAAFAELVGEPDAEPDELAEAV